MKYTTQVQSGVQVLIMGNVITKDSDSGQTLDSKFTVIISKARTGDTLYIT